MNANSSATRALNDELRRDFSRGVALVTPGVMALGPEAAERIFHTVSEYSDFTPDNDPYGEGDFGSFEIEGETIFFKIDYYNRDMSEHSSDPSDPAVTKRVITVMRADEY
jgi:hypothetical protein